MKILLLLLSVSAFAELEPKTHMLELENYPDEYLALEAKEICKGQNFEAQKRADKICYAYRYISAVRGGFILADNVQLDYMLRVSRSDAYDWIEVPTRIYECKRPGKHKVMLRPWKFLKINCLTE